MAPQHSLSKEVNRKSLLEYRHPFTIQGTLRLYFLFAALFPRYPCCNQIQLRNSVATLSGCSST